MTQSTTTRLPAVTSTTLENVERVLRDAEEPVNRSYILSELKKLGTSTTPPRLNAALDFWARHAQLVEGSKGIQWTGTTSARLRRAKSIGRRLA